MMTATEQRKPGFLDLPPEMRNRVYKLALIEKDEEIEVDATWQPPALLSTCKQIRSETLHMAYQSNAFIFKITDCDASLFVAFDKHVESLPEELRDTVSYKIRLFGRDWDNLMVWCRHVWKGEVIALHKRYNATKLWTVVYGATKIAKHAQGSWKKCKLQLNAFRAVAGKLDYRQLM